MKNWYCKPASEAEAIEIANNGGGLAASLLSIGAIYDAIKSGSLKAPEVD